MQTPGHQVQTAWGNHGIGLELVAEVDTEGTASLLGIGVTAGLGDFQKSVVDDMKRASHHIFQGMVTQRLIFLNKCHFIAMGSIPGLGLPGNLFGPTSRAVDYGRARANVAKHTGPSSL